MICYSYCDFDIVLYFPSQIQRYIVLCHASFVAAQNGDLGCIWHFAKSSSTFEFKCSAPQIYSLPISSSPSNLQYSSKYKMHFLPKDLPRVLLRELFNKNGKHEKEQIHLERLTAER